APATASGCHTIPTASKNNEFEEKVATLLQEIMSLKVEEDDDDLESGDQGDEDDDDDDDELNDEDGAVEENH
ncbi:hypothetical protein FKM82_001424, partial [Ascaphus truei]